MHNDILKAGTKNPKLIPILTWRLNQRWCKRINKDTATSALDSDKFTFFSVNAFFKNKSAKNSLDQPKIDSVSTLDSDSLMISNQPENADSSVSVSSAFTPPADDDRDQEEEIEDQKISSENEIPFVSDDLTPPSVGEKRPRSSQEEEGDDIASPKTKILRTIDLDDEEKQDEEKEEKEK